MASLQKTFTGDLSTAIASRLLSAYFKYEDDNYIAQGKPGSNVSGTDPMMPGGGGGGNSPINPEIVDRTPFDGLVKKPSIVNTKSSKGIVVRDQKLGNFVAAVAVSISSSLNSINEKLDESSDGISAAKDGIDQTYKKLEQSGDNLETKLDAIIDALRRSNAFDDAGFDEAIEQSEAIGSLDPIATLLTHKRHAILRRFAYLNPVSAFPVIYYIERKVLEIQNLRLLVRGKTIGLTVEVLEAHMDF